MENLLNLYKTPELMDVAATERSRLEEVVKSSFTQLIELGYSEFTIEAFYDVSSNAVDAFLSIILKIKFLNTLKRNSWS